MHRVSEGVSGQWGLSSGGCPNVINLLYGLLVCFRYVLCVMYYESFIVLAKQAEKYRE